MNKRIFSAVMAGAMVVSGLAAAESFTPAATYEVGERSYDAGVITPVPAAEGGGTVTYDVYSGIAGKDYTDEAVYTYNSYTAALTSGMNWDPLSWETDSDASIVDYITTGYYTFTLNSDKTGYSVVPMMAADIPQDVTGEYVGSYGVEEGETGKAWRIALRTDLKWSNGDPINADTVIYSMQQQLNPKMLNRRADSWYDGAFSIVNAKNYLYAGGTVYNPINETTTADDDLYINMWDFWGLEGCVDADGNACPNYASIKDTTEYRDEAVAEGEAEAWVSAAYIWENYFGGLGVYDEYLAIPEAAKAVTWDDVGLKKIDDYTVDYIVEEPIAGAAYYVPYYLTSSDLVYEPLYESCKTFYGADGAEVATEEEADSVTTNYCRTLETSISYGPYMLTAFELDKEYVLSRNDNWYGYNDGEHSGWYQTDNIVVSVIEDHATAMLAFEQGKLDAVSLQSEDMDKYASSSYISYTPETYTTKLSFNTDYAKLLEHGTNSQILVVDEFREAFAYAIDRAHFASAYTAAGTPGFGLLNSVYVYDPFTGANYRESEAAKTGLCTLYGMTWGEGGDYATLDEAYEALTAYDMARATEKLQEAYDKAVAAGIYDGSSDITIDLRVYTDDTIYVQMFNYFNTQLQEAAKGTGFEGKLSMTMTVDADYYETNYSGGADMIFTTWGGAAMAPFTLLYDCYCDSSDGSGNQMEYGYDTSAISLTFHVEGVGDVTDTLQNWANWANNADVDSLTGVIGKFADYDYATQCAFFSGMETCLLNWYTTTPIYYRNAAELRSQKVENATDTYNIMTGYGGFEFMTYNYSDEAWSEYIAQNTLEY